MTGFLDASYKFDWSMRVSYSHGFDRGAGRTVNYIGGVGLGFGLDWWSRNGEDNSLRGTRQEKLVLDYSRAGGGSEMYIDSLIV